MHYQTYSKKKNSVKEFLKEIYPPFVIEYAIDKHVDQEALMRSIKERFARGCGVIVFNPQDKNIGDIEIKKLY